MKLIKLVVSSNPDKKYDAYLDVNGKERKVSFGAKGMSDYTQHHDDERKERYIKRHRANEDWSDPLTAGFWSKHYLWNLKTKEESLKYIKHHYHL